MMPRDYVPSPRADESFTEALHRAQRQSRKSAARRPRPKLTGLAATIAERWPNDLMPEEAQSWARRWLETWIEPTEITAWWDAGMSWGDVVRVVEVRNLGMTPETMGEMVGGRTVLSQLKSGANTAGNIAHYLRRRDEG